MAAFPAGFLARKIRPTIRWSGIVVLTVGLLSPTVASAIEMFTYFGDGSRVPLPSLETPIEAYPGIPLRSDRLRARRRAQRYRSSSGVPVANARGISIRSMPAVSAPDPDNVFQPAPAAEPVPAPTPSRTRSRRWRR